MRHPYTRLFVLSAALLLLVGGVARCDSSNNGTTIDFESLPDNGLVAGPGKNSRATALVSGEAAHSGTRSGKVAYSFTSDGYIEFQLANPVVCSQATRPIVVTMWVKGAAKQDFNNVALRFLGANDNVYQYRAPELSEAFNADGWTRFQMTLDPQKYLGTWGPSADKTLTPPLRFIGLGAEHSTKAPTSGTIFVDDITVQPADAAGVVVVPKVSVISDHPISIVRLGEKNTFTASLAPPTTVRYRWRASDIDGKTLSQTPVKATHNGSAPDPFTVSPTGPGYILVSCEILDTMGGVNTEGHSSLAVFDRPGAPSNQHPPFRFGINSHLSRWSVAEDTKLIELMRLTGFDIVRDGADWNGVELREGVWNWARMDGIVDALKAAHIDLSCGLAYTARWASTGDAHSKDWHQWNNAPPITDKYVDYAKAAVARYKSYVHYWEIWNEPDISFWLGTASQYADLLGPAVKGIHEADPTAIVLSGGISEVNLHPNFATEFLTKATTKPDIFAYHSHGPLANLPVARVRVDGYLAQAGLKSTPIWNNESGIAVLWGTSLREQAIVLAKKIATSEALGDRAFFIYDMIDDGTDPADPEHNMGVFNHDFSPKPAAPAVHTSINQLAGKTFDRNLSDQKERPVYCYRGPDETVVDLWDERPDTTESVILRCDTHAATLTDLLGRTRAIEAIGGYYSFPVSYAPQYFTVAGKSPEIGVVKPVLLTPPATLLAGETHGYDLTVDNPLGTRLTGTLALQARFVGVVPKSVAVDVAPHASQTVHVQLALPPDADPTNLLHVQLTPTTQFPPVSRDAVLRTAMMAPWLGAQESPEARAPLVTLDTRRNVVSLFQATPMESLKFHDADHFSAKVWIYHVTDGILVHVAVNDPIHCQKEAPGNYWKGDSVQVAMIGPSERLMEWTSALTADGPRIERSVWPEEDASLRIGERVHVVRSGTTTTYDITLLAANPEIARAIEYGCKMSLIVNDNDGTGRKGWIEWTPGIGRDKDPTPYVPIAFRSK